MGNIVQSNYFLGEAITKKNNWLDKLSVNTQAIKEVGWELTGLIQEDSSVFRIGNSREIRLFGLCYAMDGGYKEWNPYRDRHYRDFCQLFAIWSKLTN